MTDADWASSWNLRTLLPVAQARLTVRQARLWGVAYARLAWRAHEHPTCQEALEVAEQYADGLASAHELRWATQTKSWGTGTVLWEEGALWSALFAPDAEAPFLAEQLAVAATLGGRRKKLRRSACALLRCILAYPVGPLRSPPWNCRAVELAQAIYAERAFDRLPILADVLEEAGCTDLAVLAHCRGPEVHTRGCWVVDWLLGKG